MSYTTAVLASPLHIGSSFRTGAAYPDMKDAGDSGMELLASALTTAIRMKAEAALIAPLDIPAVWLRNVEQRLLSSVEKSGEELAAGLDSLPQALAEAGLRFFQVASDVLPGEPYLYRSRLGDLVAEYRGPNGQMTTVIGSEFGAALVSVDGNVFQHKFSTTPDGLEKARSHIRDLSKKVCPSKHGKSLAAESN